MAQQYGSSTADNEAVNQMVEGWREAGASEQDIQAYLKDREQAYKDEKPDNNFDVYDCNWHALNVFLLGIHSWERIGMEAVVVGFQPTMVWHLIPKIIDRITFINAPDILDLYAHVMEMGKIAAAEIRKNQQ